MDRRPVSLSLLCGGTPRVRPRLLPERTMVMKKNITNAIPPAEINKEKGCNNSENDFSVSGWTRNTDLCVDVKTFLFKDRITQIGKEYSGVLTRDKEDHYQFIETLPHNQGKRNPQIYNGEHITATLRDNGSVRLNFKPMKIDDNFVIEAYAFEVANEIVKSLKGLVKETSARE